MKRILSLIFIGSMFFMFSPKMDASQFNTGFRFSNSSHRYHSRSYKRIHKKIRKNERRIFKLRRKIDKYKRKLYITLKIVYVVDINIWAQINYQLFRI